MLKNGATVNNAHTHNTVRQASLLVQNVMILLLKKIHTKYTIQPPQDRRVNLNVRGNAM